MVFKSRNFPRKFVSFDVLSYNRTLLGLIRCHVADGKHNCDESVPLMAGVIRSMQIVIPDRLLT